MAEEGVSLDGFQPNAEIEDRSRPERVLTSYEHDRRDNNASTLMMVMESIMSSM
jgi:hypothetical protein